MFLSTSLRKMHFAIFIAVINALKWKLSFFSDLAWHCSSPVYCFESLNSWILSCSIFILLSCLFLVLFWRIFFAIIHFHLYPRIRQDILWHFFYFLLLILHNGQLGFHLHFYRYSYLGYSLILIDMLYFELSIIAKPPISRPFLYPSATPE